MARGYARVVSACSLTTTEAKAGGPQARVVTRGGRGRRPPPAMGAQVPVLVAPRFDVDSSYRLAPEWGQVGTGTVLCAATSVNQGVPRVGGARDGTGASVEPEQGGGGKERNNQAWLC